MKYVIHTDGGARGNPGPAASGFIIHHNGSLLCEKGIAIGTATNNVAEYTAVLLAYTWLIQNIPLKNDHASYDFFLDSLLVVNQLNGIFKIKNSDLREILMKIKIHESMLGGTIRYHHVRRENNTRADYWVNRALDTIQM